MRSIPDSPENTPHQSKPPPHSAAHSSQPRRRLRDRRPRTTLTPSKHAHAACCTLHRMRVTGILWKSLAVGRAVASARSTDAGRRRSTDAMDATPAPNRLRSRSSPPDEDRSRSPPRNRRRPAMRHCPCAQVTARPRRAPQARV